MKGGGKYVDDVDWIQNEIEGIYRSVMLEEFTAKTPQIIRCFLKGNYYYQKRGFSVQVIEGLLRLLKASSEEKKRIIIANLHSRLDAIERYFEPENYPVPDDDIPF